MESYKRAQRKTTMANGGFVSDERLAPLNYLLTPKFLSPNHARIAIYS
jgi:hypothetical protein